MKEYGLIGYPLGHSYSQKHFEEKFNKLNISDAKYSLFPISEISKLENVILKNKNLMGLNVTIPYKELVIPFLNKIDSQALEIGSVNTIKIHRNKEKICLKGYNTDIDGFRMTLKNHNISLKNNKALILGSGGSAKTVAFVLKSCGVDYFHVSRKRNNTKSINYDKLNKALVLDHKIIINATPVGMYPNINKCPNIPYEFITKDHIIIDLVYNPEETLFLIKCQEKNAKTVNGLTMLYHQADKAWEIWNS